MPQPHGDDDGVLRLLASGMSLDAIAEHRRGGRDLSAILTKAAAVIRATELLPPTHAALLSKLGLHGSIMDLAAVRQRAEVLIAEYLAGSRLSGAGVDAADYAALRYAETVVRQEEVVDALGRIDSNNAPLQAQLTGADRRRVDNYLLYRNVKGRFETLDSLLELWERSVVRAQERGDTYSYDEYVDRLIGRDSLAEVLAAVSPAERAPLDGLVAAQDAHFVDATREVSEWRSPRTPWRPEGWWWFRVPSAWADDLRPRSVR